jgi:hypothetical protein
MKKFSILLTVVFLISIGSSLQQVTAQEKTKAEQEKEFKIQQAIDQQKKAMAYEKKALEEATQILKEKQVELIENIKNIEVEVKNADKPGGSVRIYSPKGNRFFPFDEPLAFSGPDGQAFYGHSTGDSERTTWEFSKSVKESTYSKGFSFDVEKTVKTVVMSVMGDCKAGEIRILIMKPAGKEYSNMVIDEFGNLNWRKSFTISETDNLDKVGEWKFVIYSTKATGFFKISLQTY